MIHTSQDPCKVCNLNVAGICQISGYPVEYIAAVGEIEQSPECNECQIGSEE